MATLCILAFLLATAFLLMAWVLAITARLVGSSHARWRIGLLAALFLMAINGIFAAISLILFPTGTVSHPAFGLLLLILQVGAIFIMLKRLFRLSFWRTFVPYAAGVALPLLELGLGIAVIKPFVYEAFAFSSQSMSPTIKLNDRIVANKLLPAHRWDLVVYRTNGPHHALDCKRLIALPGERLKFDHGDIYINGQIIAAPRPWPGAVTPHRPPCHLPQPPIRTLSPFNWVATNTF